MNTEWILEDFVCRHCGSTIMVTQGQLRDYLYYCSNQNCPHFSFSEDLYDDEECSFAKSLNEK